MQKKYLSVLSLNGRHFFLICLFSFFVFNSKAQDIEAMPVAEDLSHLKEEDVYGEDGTYKRTVGGKVRISGFHENKKRVGVFKYYDKYGQLEKKETYADGILNGGFSLYTAGRLSSFKEFKKGLQVNYEYGFDLYGDTILMAGPYPGSEIKTGKIMLLQKLIDKSNPQGMQIKTYDTLSFKSNKPVFIAHHEFITGQKSKEHRYTEVMLYENKYVTYKPAFVEALFNKTKNFNAGFSAYAPSGSKARIKKFDANGKLVLLSDSGYVLRFNSGVISKDSITSPAEGKVCHAGYYKNGQIAFEVRYDTAKSHYSTNLYYGENKKLLYEVGSRNYKPAYVKIYSDSVKKASKENVLVDCFGTAYLFDENKRIDTSFSRAEYKMRMKEKIKDGRYFYLPNAPMYPREGYRVMEIFGSRKNEYLLDSTLKANPDKGTAFQVFQKDTLIYLVKEKANSYENRFLISKYYREGDQLYLVHNQLKSNYLYYRENLVSLLEKDSMPVFKSELLSENEFKKALKMKRITMLTKEEFLKWMEFSEKIDPAMQRVQEATVMGLGESIEIKAPFSIVASEIYRMGYNPYFSRQEVQELKMKFNLSNEETGKWRFLFR